MKLHILKAWYVYLKDNFGKFEWTDETIININAFDSYHIDIYDPELPIKFSQTLMKVPSLILSKPKPMFFSAC